MHRVLKTGALIVLLGFGLITTATAQAPQDDNYGFIRFAHTAVDVPSLDIYVMGGSATPLVRNLQYGQSTDYFTLPSITDGFLARASGSGANGEILARLTRGVKTNQSQIIVAAGLADKRAFVLEPLTLVRDNTRGRARVRVFNTVWGGPYLGVTDNQGHAYGQDLQYLSSSGDVDVDPGTYDFEIKTGSGQTLFTESGFNLSSDKIYSLIIVGGMENTPPVHFLIVVSDQEVTRVRFVNRSHHAADIYIKGDPSPFVAGLPGGASTDFLPLPSGAITFYLRPSGTPPSGAELAFVASQLRPGRDVTITIDGEGVETQMGISDDHLSPQSGGTATPERF